MEHPNVFTIPPGAPFLDTLVAALLGGRLIEGFDASAPFALADVTLYLPTRRAARAIRDASSPGSVARSFFPASARSATSTRMRLASRYRDDPDCRRRFRRWSASSS